MTNGAVAAEVERALGVKSGKIELIPTDEYNEVYRVDLGGETVIFKTHNEYDVTVESWAYRRAAGAGVPVPEVLAADTSCASFPAPYLIMREAPGRPLHSLGLAPEAARPALLGIGEALRTLHGVVMEGFGPLDLDAFKQTGVMAGKRATESELIARDTWELPYLVNHGLVDDVTVKRIADAQARSAPGFDGARSALLHADMGTDHVWVDPHTLRVTALIDFGDARAGDPAWEFACMAIHEPQALPAVLDGYGSPDRALIEAKLDMLALIRLCGELRWMHERSLDTQDWPDHIHARLRAVEGRLTPS